MLSIEGGKLNAIMGALSSFKGRKGVPLSVRLSNLRRSISKYHEAWREEELLPAIRTFMDDPEASVIPDERLQEFLIAQEGMLRAVVEVDAKPIPLTEFGDEIYLEDDLVMDLLLEQGVIVDADS